LNECRHNLIEIQKQIIEYLNQIKYQSVVIEKLRQIKYLRDQFTIRASTDIDRIIGENNLLVFEANPVYYIKLSLDNLTNNDEASQSIKKVAAKQKTTNYIKAHLAPNISEAYLISTTEEEIQINLEEVKNGFLASGNQLFDFVLAYPFEKDLSFEEKVTVYCQLISLYESSFEITNQFESNQEVEYAIVYPK